LEKSDDILQQSVAIANIKSRQVSISNKYIFSPSKAARFRITFALACQHGFSWVQVSAKASFHEECSQ